MRALFIAILLSPALCIAEIPVGSLELTGELRLADGKPFYSQIDGIVVDGNQIAVLSGRDNPGDTARSIVRLFSRDATGVWQLTSTILPPERDRGPIRSFGFQGDVMAFSRFYNPDFIPAIPNRVYIVERVGNSWTYTTSLSGEHAMLEVDQDRIAISKIQGVDIHHRRAIGDWPLEASLDQLGITSIGSSVRGPRFDLDGDRLLIGTQRYISTVGLEYFAAAGTLYQRNADATWILRDHPATQIINRVTTSVPLVSVSLAGDNSTIGGSAFHLNPYGGAHRTADLSAVTSNLAESASARVLANHWGIVSQDLYRISEEGYWREPVRLATGVLATDGRTVVTAVPDGEFEGRTAFRLMTANLPDSALEVHIPATLTGVDVWPPLVLRDEPTILYAMTWVGAAGNGTVEKIEYQANGGAWEPMTPRDGAFDEPFESATARVSRYVEGLIRYPICIRVTDSAGRVTELLDRGREPCPIVEITQSQNLLNDYQPPELSAVRTGGPSLISRGEESVVYAFADDSASGEICGGQPGCQPTHVQSLQFRIDDGVWRSMKPFPGMQREDFFFGDEEYEAAQGVLPPPWTTGVHDICVRAFDTAGGLTAPQCVELQVTD